MQLYTKRLQLREFTETDFEDVFAYESDPLVVQYVCYGPYTEEACQRQLEFHVAHQSAQPRIYYYLGIVLPEEERLIGWCGLELDCSINQEGEIGYALNRSYWGCGYMTEAARAMITCGFEQLQLHRIYATCHPANRGSIRVLEKLGMRYEGYLREQKRCRGKWRDTVINAVLDHEWGAISGKQAKYKN